MEKGLKELLESAVLSEETKTAFLEAWSNKLEEAKVAIREAEEVKLREEYAARYAADKAEMVEAMDRMLTDAVQAQANESFEATKALKEERARLTQAIKESRAEYKTRIANHTKVVETFMLNQLKEELAGITADHKMLQAQRVKLATEIAEAKANYEASLAEHVEKLQNFVMAKLNEELTKVKAQEKELAEGKVLLAKKLREHRMELNEQTAARLNKLEAFVVGQLSKELKEMAIDKRNLVEAKVRLVSEAKQKMDETRKEFINRASKVVESTFDKALRTEMTQLKEDIRQAKENLFGRRLFEAFQSEFMTSYLSEGTQVKKLSLKLDEASKQLNEAAEKMATQQQLLESMERRVKLSEERATRVKTMNELLSPLSKEKRDVMENLLETIKTKDLKEAFHKYLPAVTNEGAKGSASQGRRVISETPVTEKKTVAITGNRNNRLAESARAENVQSQNVDAEIVELRRLAGIEK